jgi:hypothetical protein
MKHEKIWQPGILLEFWIPESLSDALNDALRVHLHPDEICRVLPAQSFGEQVSLQTLHERVMGHAKTVLFSLHLKNQERADLLVDALFMLREWQGLEIRNIHMDVLIYLK